MKKNKIMAIVIIVIMMSLGSVHTVFAQEGQKTEAVNPADVKLNLIPWRSQYFDSFRTEDLKNDSIPFFVSDKFRIRLGQSRTFTKNGVVAIDSMDNILRCTRLKFIRRVRNGMVVQLPSGIQITYTLTTAGRYVYRSGSYESFVMWFYGHKRQNFEEEKTEATE